MKGVRLKDLGSFKTGLTYSPDNLCDSKEGVLVLRSANIQNDRIDLGDSVYVNSSIPSSMYVRKGDILICSRNGSANLVGKTAIIDNDLNATWGAFMMLLRTKYNSKYINYLLNICIRREKGRFATSTINQLTNSMLGGIHVDLFTDEMEQQRIVDYLDAKLSEIDKRVSVLEKQRDAYMRLKKSMIHQVVTRGLNPDVSLKDSGIEWIGMIPEHWELKRVKDLCNVICGATPKDTPANWDGDIIWISPADMVDFGEIEKGARTITEIGYKSCGTTLVPKGSIVMSTRAPIGKANIALNDLCTNQGCKCLTSSCLCMNYMLYLIWVNKEHFQALGRGTTFIELSTKDLSLYQFALPTFSEQQAIANYLDEKCAKIDAAVENIGKQIDASKRLKRAIINEAISGKTIL